MGKRVAFAASVAASSIALIACGAGHHVQRGADLYGEGRYVEADEVFARNEPRLARASLSQQATYAAYRGATFIALGDLPHAQRWLSFATDIERRHPGTLRTDERAFLDGAWRALTNRLQPTPPAAATALASSSQVPVPSVQVVTPPSAPPQGSLIPQ